MSSSRLSAAADECQVVAPVLMTRTRAEHGLETLKNEPELVMLKPYEQEAARMRPARSRPLGTEACEVTHVERHEDPVLGAGERQQLLVGPRVQSPFLGCGSRVVALSSERHGDPAHRDVRIEQETHEAALTLRLGSR